MMTGQPSSGLVKPEFSLGTVISKGTVCMPVGVGKGLAMVIFVDVGSRKGIWSNGGT